MPVLFMAGFCRQYEDGEHFVILTTAANVSMEPVHDRMPLILEYQEIAEWMFDDSETCSLLGNLLDNAIEACMRMDDNADKWISVKIENQKQLLFIKIENSVNEAPVMEKGRPVSVKRDKMRHGYGLKNVERILNKYDGTIVYLSRDKAFQIKLLFL